MAELSVYGVDIFSRITVVSSRRGVCILHTIIVEVRRKIMAVLQKKESYIHREARTKLYDVSS